MDHSDKAVGQLILAGGNGSIDFEVAELALDAAPLLVEPRPYSIFKPRFDLPGMTGSIFRSARSA